MSTLFTLIWLVWLAKPIYWLVRYLFLWAKEGNSDTTYLIKLQDWLKQTWNYVRWQKDDL